MTAESDLVDCRTCHGLVLKAMNGDALAPRAFNL